MIQVPQTISVVHIADVDFPSVTLFENCCEKSCSLCVVGRRNVAAKQYVGSSREKLLKEGSISRRYTSRNF